MADPQPDPKPKHAFLATRKGVPMGETGDWWKFCDECGERVAHPIHEVSSAEQDAALIRAIEGACE